MQVNKIKPTSQNDVFKSQAVLEEKMLARGTVADPWLSRSTLPILIQCVFYHAIQWTWCWKTKLPQDLKNRPRLEGIVSFGIGCGRVWVLQTNLFFWNSSFTVYSYTPSNKYLWLQKPTWCLYKGRMFPRMDQICQTRNCEFYLLKKNAGLLPVVEKRKRKFLFGTEMEDGEREW